MRFTARRLIASLSVLGLLAAQSTAFAADEQKKVEFFEGKEFAGASESAKDDTTISTQYNFSKADTKSESKTVTYKIPSQSITLEPGQTVEVRARLEKVKTAGKVRLIGDINGTESGYVNLQKLVGDIGLVPTPDHKLTTGLVYKWKSFEQKPYELSFSNQHVEGEGTYQAECGSNLYIDVVDVSTNKVQTVQANATETQGDRSANGSSKDAVELTANAGTFDMTK